MTAHMWESTDLLSLSLSHPNWSVISQDPSTDELSLVVKALSKDVLSTSLTRDIDVFLQEKEQQSAVDYWRAKHGHGAVCHGH